MLGIFTSSHLSSFSSVGSHNQSQIQLNFYANEYNLFIYNEVHVHLFDRNIVGCQRNQ